MAVAPRRTRQKQAIRAAFLDADRPLSADEVLALAQGDVNGLSLATVYRTLLVLQEEHWLEPVNVPGEAKRYEVAGKAHHHHFRCDTCNRLFELQGCDIVTKPRLPRGFRASGHEFLVYGQCAGCRIGMSA